MGNSSVYIQNDCGDKQTILLDGEIMELRNVISEKTSGKLDTNVQAVDMGASKNWGRF